VVQGDQLRKDTAEANARALEARVELEKFKAPRTLSTVQRARISKKMKPFVGTLFDVASTNDGEPLGLVNAIEDMLGAADWKQKAWTSLVVITRNGKPSLGLSIETGISVQVEISQQSVLLETAKALAEALVEEGIEARAEISPVAPNDNHDAIHVVVGKKP